MDIPTWKLPFMKPFILLILALAAVRAHAADPIVAASRIDAVKVFRSGALITRTATVDLPAGTSELRFPALSPFLQENTVQLRTPKGCTVLSVQATGEYLAEIPLPPAYQSLQEQIDKLQQGIRRDKASVEVLQQEEALLLANLQVGSQQQGVTVAALESVSAYFRNRLASIKTEKINLADRLEANGKLLDKLKRQQAELRQRLMPDNARTVVVRLEAAAAGQAEVQLSYLSMAASWASEYDLRVEELGQPLGISRKGAVVNASGEDWNRVKLTLSTGDPARDHTAPALQPWWIDLQQPEVAMVRGNRIPLMAMEEKAVASFADAPVVTTSDNLATTEFAIAVPMDVPADGKPHTTVLEQLSVPADYRYVAAPRQSPYAVLTATVRDLGSLGLHSGKAAIHYGRTFVGETWIDANRAADSLVLSLGADEGIALERKLRKDESTRNFFGNKVEKTTAYTISVRNGKKMAIRLSLYDQIPLSRNTDLEVRSTIGAGGTLDAESGIVTWELELAPGARQDLNFSYQLRYPKGRSVQE